MTNRKAAPVAGGPLFIVIPCYSFSDMQTTTEANAYEQYNISVPLAQHSYTVLVTTPSELALKGFSDHPVFRGRH